MKKFLFLLILFICSFMITNKQVFAIDAPTIYQYYDEPDASNGNGYISVLFKHKTTGVYWTHTWAFTTSIIGEGRITTSVVLTDTTFKMIHTWSPQLGSNSDYNNGLVSIYDFWANEDNYYDLNSSSVKSNIFNSTNSSTYTTSFTNANYTIVGYSIKGSITAVDDSSLSSNLAFVNSWGSHSSQLKEYHSLVEQLTNIYNQDKIAYAEELSKLNEILSKESSIFDTLVDLREMLYSQLVTCRPSVNLAYSASYQNINYDWGTLVSVSSTDIQLGQTYTVSVYLDASADSKVYWNSSSGVLNEKQFNVQAGLHRYSYTFVAKKNATSVSILLSKWGNGDNVTIKPSKLQIEKSSNLSAYEEPNKTICYNKFDFISEQLSYIYNILNTYLKDINDNLLTINQKIQIVIDILNSWNNAQLEEDTEPLPNEGITNNKDKENAILNKGDSGSITSSVGVELDTTANNSIWSIANNFITCNSLVFGLFISLLSLGVVKLILNR